MAAANLRFDTACNQYKFILNLRGVVYINNLPYARLVI